MSLSAFLLVLAAATLHALWNLAAKKVGGDLAVFWVGLCFAGLLLVPAALILGLRLPAGGVPYILTTALIHAFYFGLLAGSYRHGDMSLVYPLARGTGVAGTAVVAAVLIGEQPSLRGGAGIALVCVGVVVLGLRGLGSRNTWPVIVLALLVGLATTAYSIVDKLGVGQVHPLVYIAGLSTGTAFFLAPWVLLRFRSEVRQAWQDRKGSCAWVGLGSMGTYLIILFAFQQSPASYVVAIREMSIVVVVILGRAVLHEPMTFVRAASITSILTGAVLVKMG